MEHTHHRPFPLQLFRPCQAASGCTLEAEAEGDSVSPSKPAMQLGSTGPPCCLFSGFLELQAITVKDYYFKALLRGLSKRKRPRPPSETGRPFTRLAAILGTAQQHTVYGIRVAPPFARRDCSVDSEYNPKEHPVRFFC